MEDKKFNMITELYRKRSAIKVRLNQLEEFNVNKDLTICFFYLDEKCESKSIYFIKNENNDLIIPMFILTKKNLLNELEEIEQKIKML